MNINDYSYAEQQIIKKVAEECAKVCEEIVEYPAGHGGQWEGYGAVRKTREGEDSAAVIREKFDLNAD